MKKSKTSEFMDAIKRVRDKNGVVLGKSFEDYIYPYVRDYFAADEIICKDGLMVEDYRGELKEHPLIKVRKDCYDRVLNALKGFQLTKKNANEDDLGPLAAFINGKQ